MFELRQVIVILFGFTGFLLYQIWSLNGFHNPITTAVVVLIGTLVILLALIFYNDEYPEAAKIPERKEENKTIGKDEKKEDDRGRMKKLDWKDLGSRYKKQEYDEKRLFRSRSPITPRKSFS